MNISANEVYGEYERLINENMESNSIGAVYLRENMHRSPLFYKGDFRAKTLQIPKIYTEDTIEHFRKIADTSYSIFTKVIREYLNCSDYRALFPFSKELEQLIMTPVLYDSLLPIARFDIFYNEETGDFNFCEVNTDGTSAMNEDRLLNELYIDNRAHQEIIRKYKLDSMELFDTWVREFMSIYKTYSKRVEKPNIAIIDFLDMGTLREFQEFARRFQKAGFNCEICDIRSLSYKDGKLMSKTGHVIDAVYRRAVTSDVMKHYDEVLPFINAVLDNAVFVAGAFCTQIIHNKWLFCALHLDRTKQFLSESERDFVERHIPKTVMLTDEYISLEEVIKNKDMYILKPLDSYASGGVFAGVEHSDDKWKDIAEGVYGKDYICQNYCPQYKTKNIDFAFGDGHWHDYINMTGLYVYNGKFAGVFSRLANGGIIASHRNERTVPSYILRGKLDFEQRY